MIKITSGIYGRRVGNHIVPTTSKDAPFSLDKAEEERLVKAGVAKYTDEKAETKEEFKTNSVAEKAVEKMSFEELKAKAVEMGIDTIYKSKNEYINAINKGAPKFDATETVVE